MFLLLPLAVKTVMIYIFLTIIIAVSNIQLNYVQSKCNKSQYFSESFPLKFRNYCWSSYGYKCAMIYSGLEIHCDKVLNNFKCNKVKLSFIYICKLRTSTYIYIIYIDSVKLILLSPVVV